MILFIKLGFIYVVQILTNVDVGADNLYKAEVRWSFENEVYDYSSYKDVSLMSIYVPPNTEELILRFQAASVPTNCERKTISVALQHGGFPIVNPKNAEFPDHFYIERTNLNHYSVPSDNETVQEIIDLPESGTWYIGSYIYRKGSKRLSQKGLSKDCCYVLSVIAVNKILTDVWDIAVEDNQMINLRNETERLFRFQVPDNVVTYDIILESCSVRAGKKIKLFDVCPVLLTLSEISLPCPLSSYHNCSEHNVTCHLTVESPAIGKWSFLKVVTDNTLDNYDGFSFNIRFTVYGCEQFGLFKQVKLVNDTTHENLTINILQLANLFNASCISATNLGKYSFEAASFTSVFFFHNLGLLPDPENELLISDRFSMMTSFRITEGEDTGGTIMINITFLHPYEFQQTAVLLCVMKDRIPFKKTLMNCSGGILLKVDSVSNLNRTVYIPYPESGTWYLAIRSVCYSDNKNERIVKCVKHPAVQFSVVQNPCFEKCEPYGVCHEYLSGVHKFSACFCYAGWQGYGCTDGSKANSLSEELLATLMLSLSNLFFIPGIVLAFKRHYFIESIVFFFNMFFSLFYHACDSSHIYKYCILEYDTLGFADFLGSFMSFWMVFLAMAKIPDTVRSCFHMFGVLMVAVLMNFDRHGLWESVLPIAVSATVTIASWSYRMIKYRRCFPSKQRWIKFLIPGLLFALVGIVIFSTVETEENYKYTHSFWHIVITLSILFLLPPKKSVKKECFEEMDSAILTSRSSDLLDHEDPSPGQNLIT